MVEEQEVPGTPALDILEESREGTNVTLNSSGLDKKNDCEYG